MKQHEITKLVNDLVAIARGFHGTEQLRERIAYAVLGSPLSNGKPPGLIDPDYARIYTQVRCIAWSYGYAAIAHGSFSRDLDIVLIPWTEKATVNQVAILHHIADATQCKITGGDAGSPKPHGRIAYTLLLPGFSDPRFVDLSFMPTTTATTRTQAP